MATGDIETKLTIARTRLVMSKPFLGALVLRLPMSEAGAQWCPTTATDARKFYYNTFFFFFVVCSTRRIAGRQIAIAEGAFGNAPHLRQRRWQFGGVEAGLHADAAAAAGRLEHERKADRAGFGQGQGFIRGQDAGAGGHRHAQFGHAQACAVFVRQRIHGVRARADETDAACFAGAGERGVLGQEAIARMQRVGAAGAGHGQQAFAMQVAFARRGRAKQVGLVGLGHIGQVAVCFGIHGHRADAQPTQAADRQFVFLLCI